MLKRGYVGTYHKMSEKHLQRYVDEFTGRHNARELDTLERMRRVVSGPVGKRLQYRELTAKAEAPIRSTVRLDSLYPHCG